MDPVFFSSVTAATDQNQTDDKTLVFLQVTMSSEDTSRLRAVHYSFDRTLQIAIHAVLTCSAHHKLLTHMHIIHQPDADKRRDTCSSRATHTIHRQGMRVITYTKTRVCIKTRALNWHRTVPLTRIANDKRQEENA